MNRNIKTVTNSNSSKLIFSNFHPGWRERPARDDCQHAMITVCDNKSFFEVYHDLVCVHERDARVSWGNLAAQHEDMANKYVDAIASALEKFHLGNTSGPVSLADKQVFTDLAWSGLDGTEIFNKKYPKGNEERKRITNRLVAETIGVYSSDAIGKPCN